MYLTTAVKEKLTKLFKVRKLVVVPDDYGHLALRDEDSCTNVLHVSITQLPSCCGLAHVHGLSLLEHHKTSIPFFLPIVEKYARTKLRYGGLTASFTAEQGLKVAFTKAGWKLVGTITNPKTDKDIHTFFKALTGYKNSVNRDDDYEEEDEA